MMTATRGGPLWSAPERGCNRRARAAAGRRRYDGRSLRAAERKAASDEGVSS